MYRALWPNVDPAQADKLELWQIAELQSRDSNTPLSEEEMNRQLIEARYKAAREGRELDPDEVFPGMSESQVVRVGSSTTDNV